MLLRPILPVSIIVVLSSCAYRFKPVAQAQVKPIDPSAYVDLSAGSRLRAVTPIFASRKYRPARGRVDGVKSSQPQSPITLAAPSGFTGYETAYYLLKPRLHGRGAAISFQYATMTKAGIVTRESRPAMRLFAVPRDVRFFRLVFLIRVSRRDHNMALLGTKRKDMLDNWTAIILAHPEACTDSRGRACLWIPETVAVRPEIEKFEAGPFHWVPIR